MSTTFSRDLGIDALIAVCAVTLATIPSAAIADQRPVPPMPSACAETACAALRSSAEVVCSEQMWDADGCEVALAELQKCFEKCPSGQ